MKPKSLGQIGDELDLAYDARWVAFDKYKNARDARRKDITDEMLDRLEAQHEWTTREHHKRAMEFKLGKEAKS